jgi:predicted acetyltransferase
MRTAEIHLRAATASDRVTLRALLDAYLGELQAFALVDASYPYFQSYFENAGRFAYLVEATIDGQPTLAGFALINRHAPSGAPVDHAMAEFCILPAFRKTGMGQRGAEMLFARHPGCWELSVVTANAGAWSFWQRVTEAFPDRQVLERDDVRILRFRTATTIPLRIPSPRG